MNKQDAVKGQLTEKGAEDYKTILKTLIRIYNGEEPKCVPRSNQIILGFGALIIPTKEELKQWIECVAWLIGDTVSEEVTSIKMVDGTYRNENKMRLVTI